MKLSHKLLQNIKNTLKESFNNMLEIKEEKANQSSTGLALLNDDNNANIYQDSINENKVYFHFLFDDYGEDIIIYTVREEKINVYDYSSNNFFYCRIKHILYNSSYKFFIFFHFIIEKDNTKSL